MAIRVECPACRATLNARDEHAGRRLKCPRCQETVEVPPTSGRPPGPGPEARTASPAKARPAAVSAPAEAADPFANARLAVAASRRTRTPAQILAAFHGEIEPVRTTPLYRLWILIVAGLMVLLPALYIALIGLIGALLIRHAVHDVVIFENVRNGKAALFLYAGPLVAGAVVVAFMLKPLFARPGKPPKFRTLDPSTEPLLYAFVDGVCASVGAPRPSRIDVDCAVNASARREGGALAVFNNELVLTIGLPLAAGLTLRQFAGVLAHEFGHFSQGTGMRVSILIRSMNFWFARVVYERDSWDETLAAWSTAGHGAETIIALVARVAVWLTRRVLWLLMMIGHAASGFLLRQMEFDADRYEARMVGGDVFAETSWRLRVMNIASQGAYADLATSWKERRLPDNLPRLIIANVFQVPEPLLDALRESEAKEKTGLFDTHPADRHRIARARAEATGGIFHLDGEATDLFRSFDSLARSCTFDHYRGLLGPEISKEQLYPVAEAIETQAVAHRGGAALDRFFLRGFHPLQLLPLPAAYPAAPGDLKAAKQALVKVRGEMERGRRNTAAAWGRWQEWHEAAVKAAGAVAFAKAGYKFNPADFDLDDWTPDAAGSALSSAESALAKLAARIAAFEAASARRLTLDLGLLESEAVVGRLAEGPARRDEARSLYRPAVFLGRLAPALIAVLRAYGTVCHMQKTINERKSPDHPKMNQGMFLAWGELFESLKRLREELKDGGPYPFEHAEPGITLRRFALPAAPSMDALVEMIEAGAEAMEKLSMLYSRVLGRLAAIAEEVEQAVGLAPLEVEEEPAEDPAVT